MKATKVKQVVIAALVACVGILGVNADDAVASDEKEFALLPPVTLTGLSATPIAYGQALKDSTITGTATAADFGTVAGTFTWTNPDTKPNVSDSGTTEYDVTFTPANTNHSKTGTAKLKLTVKSPIPYLDWDDVNKKMTGAVCTVYEVVTSGMNSFAAGKTYVVTGGVTVASAITVKSVEARPARLILCDGAKLTASKGLVVPGNYALVICAQEGGTGALEATGGNGGAGIGGGYVTKVVGGTITINGGVVTATGGSGGAGIGGSSGKAGGTVTINGGTVTATGRNGAAGIGGGVDATDQGTLTFGAGYVGGVLAGTDAASAVYMTTTAYTNDHSAKYVTMPRFVLKIPAGTHYTYVVSNETEGITGELVNGTNEYIVAKGATLKVYFTPDENYEWDGGFTNPKTISNISGDTVIYASEMPKAVTVFVAEVTVGGETHQYKDFNEAWRAAHLLSSETPATLKMLRNIHLTNTMETVTQQPE